MRPIQRSDVLDILQYEKVRPQYRDRVIKLKAARRISIGPYITLVFENRDTVLFQIQEMMRAERTVAEERIADDIAVYGGLLPAARELSATLMIEITEATRIKSVLDRFLGMDRGNTTSLQFAGERVYAVFESGRSTEAKISAVHFVRFPFTPAQARRFRTGEDQATLHVSHGTYRRRAAVPPAMRASLVHDLTA